MERDSRLAFDGMRFGAFVRPGCPALRSSAQARTERFAGSAVELVTPKGTADARRYTARRRSHEARPSPDCTRIHRTTQTARLEQGAATTTDCGGAIG